MKLNAAARLRATYTFHNTQDIQADVSEMFEYLGVQHSKVSKFKFANISVYGAQVNMAQDAVFDLCMEKLSSPRDESFPHNGKNVAVVSSELYEKTEGGGIHDRYCVVIQSSEQAKTQHTLVMVVPRHLFSPNKNHL